MTDNEMDNGVNDMDNEVNNGDYSDDANTSNTSECACSSTWWWLSLVLIGLLMAALLGATYMLWSCRRASAGVDSIAVADPMDIATAYFQGLDSAIYDFNKQ
jgi:hypothetical protein